MGPEHLRVETDTGHSFLDELCVFPGRQATWTTTSTREQELPRLSSRQSEVVVDGKPGLFRELEPAFIIQRQPIA